MGARAATARGAAVLLELTLTERVLDDASIVLAAGTDGGCSRVRRGEGGIEVGTGRARQIGTEEANWRGSAGSGQS
eukprot:351806-Chlamydomonas_euryale.AAC.6